MLYHVVLGFITNLHLEAALMVRVEVFSVFSVIKSVLENAIKPSETESTP